MMANTIRNQSAMNSQSFDWDHHVNGGYSAWQLWKL
jgi:hypothetical protein